MPGVIGKLRAWPGEVEVLLIAAGPARPLPLPLGREAVLAPLPGGQPVTERPRLGPGDEHDGVVRGRVVGPGGPPGQARLREELALLLRPDGPGSESLGRR